MKRWRIWLAVASIPLAIFGCAGNPPAVPEPQETAIQLNQRGQDAYRRGDYLEALAEYQQALSILRSVENVDGIATELMNLSVVYRQLGKLAEARSSLDEILTTSGLTFSATQQAEAAYRQASFYLDDGNETAARSWADKALQYCHGCGVEGRLYNLKARMALAAKPLDAKSLARQAADVNSRSGDKAEAANSQRLIADASLMTGDFKTAQQYYDEALRLDKENGSASKIALDLMGLGRSLARQGRQMDAVDFFQRAYSVSEGSGDVQAMGAAMAEIKKLTP